MSCVRALQVSYKLLAALDQGMEALMTGPDTNPQTLATALSAFQPTLPVLASTNTTITELNKYIVSPLLALPCQAHKAITNTLRCVSWYIDGDLCQSCRLGDTPAHSSAHACMGCGLLAFCA